MQTEPEQWAVTEADIEGTPDWAFSLASTIVLGNYGCGHAAVLIQRTFEDRERKLREDAARYRWLRDVSCPPHNFYISVPDEFHGVKYGPDEVDAYIDAARAALGEKP